MRNILLIGKACSGKTTAANYIVKKYGYSKYNVVAYLEKVKSGEIIKDDNKFIIDDVRFKNDVEQIKKAFDCITVKINRNKVVRKGRDVRLLALLHLENDSEIKCDYINADYEIDNVHELDQLYNELDMIVLANKD